MLGGYDRHLCLGEITESCSRAVTPGDKVAAKGYAAREYGLEINMTAAAIIIGAVIIAEAIKSLRK